jgi:hypothetical protein
MLDGNALDRVVKRGAAVIADAVRLSLSMIPVRKKGDGRTDGITSKERELLTKHFGVTPIKRDRDGFLHAKIGWDGYTSRARKGYPKGFPVPFLAATIERGASWRDKIPFIRNAVKQYKTLAVEEMQKALDEELEDIFNFEGRT